jgi:hypothetical protein
MRFRPSVELGVGLGEVEEQPHASGSLVISGKSKSIVDFPATATD